MKRKNDLRHLKRIRQMQELFSWSFNNHPASAEIKPITAKVKTIDKKITAAAPQRQIKAINKIDLAILRLAVFEITYKKELPPKVSIDEAIELAKEYGSDSSPAFINGALGKLVENEKIKI